ncbi:Fic family protein [Boudabousia tangfeifanii]|uniref:Fic family protein n=1 Tax=Boudabousia tangfeifanii TaxID=1912795 RepID=UPI00195B8F4C|nr:Fic family protein [Boudabousia tangfeifanii]
MRIANCETQIRDLLSDQKVLADLSGVNRFLLRSEAIASSQIEGVAPAARRVALAELNQLFGAKAKVSEEAELVARNLTTVKNATIELASAPEITWEAIESLEKALLDDENIGLRQVQNWVGGSSYNPLEAEYVPPIPESLPELCGDLVDYLNGASHSALVQAALVHAQFETIHPFVDGNGRIGRALIQTVLVRRGLTPSAVLPISQILSTWRERYSQALNDFRVEGECNSTEQQTAIVSWLIFFISVCEKAVELAQELGEQLLELRQGWEAQLEQYLAKQPRQKTLRHDSATAIILRGMSATPVMTVRSAAQIYGLSESSAKRALDMLCDAGILAVSGEGSTKGRKGSTDFFRNDDLLNLLTLNERRYASTQFNTQISKPNRSTPAPLSRPSEA